MPVAYRDPSLKRAPARLEEALRSNGVDHEVKVYAEAGHAFLNDQDPADVSTLVRVIGRFSRAEYHEPSARDARRRIAAFFDEHLKR